MSQKEREEEKSKQKSPQRDLADAWQPGRGAISLAQLAAGRRAADWSSSSGESSFALAGL